MGEARSILTHNASTCWCWCDNGIKLLSRSMVLSPRVLQPGFGLHPSFWSELGGGTHGQPIRAHALPFLDQHVVGFEKAADAIALPSRNLLQNRRQYGQCAGAQDRPFGNLGNIR